VGKACSVWQGDDPYILSCAGQRKTLPCPTSVEWSDSHHLDLASSQPVEARPQIVDVILGYATELKVPERSTTVKRPTVV